MTKTGSVRERIAAIHTAQLSGATTPSQAAQWLTTLGALSGNVMEEIRDAEIAYRVVYAGCLDTEGKANRAKIRAELTPEFQRLRRAQDTLKLVESMCSGLRYLLKAHETEVRASR